MSPSDSSEILIELFCSMSLTWIDLVAATRSADLCEAVKHIASHESVTE